MSHSKPPVPTSNVSQKIGLMIDVAVKGVGSSNMRDSAAARADSEAANAAAEAPPTYHTAVVGSMIRAALSASVESPPPYSEKEGETIVPTASPTSEDKIEFTEHSAPPVSEEKVEESEYIAPSASTAAPSTAEQLLATAPPVSTDELPAAPLQGASLGESEKKEPQLG